MSDDKVVNICDWATIKHLTSEDVGLSKERANKVVDDLKGIEAIHEQASREGWSEEKLNEALSNFGVVRFDMLDFIDSEERMFNYLQTYFAMHTKYHEGSFSNLLDDLVRFRQRHPKK